MRKTREKSEYSRRELKRVSECANDNPHDIQLLQYRQ